MKRSEKKTFMCPHCQAMIPEDSIVCPECGSDRETGWSEEYNADMHPADGERTRERPLRHMGKRIARIAGVLLAAGVAAGFISLELPPYGVYIGCAIFAAAIIALILSRGRPLSAERKEELRERELLSLCGGDEELADRLVRFETVRAPGAPHAVHLKNAIDRLLRDRER